MAFSGITPNLPNSRNIFVSSRTHLGRQNNTKLTCSPKNQCLSCFPLLFVLNSSPFFGPTEKATPVIDLYSSK
jgi:hypothetical protein